MAKIDRLYENIKSDANIELAYNNVLKSKRPHQRERYKHRKYKYINNAKKILDTLRWDVNYKPPFIIKDNKERKIITCSFTDKIVQEAIRTNLDKIFIKTYFIQNTFQSIKGRGIHKAMKIIGHRIRSIANTNKSGRAYVLHIDVRKYYESIDSAMLMDTLRQYIFSKNILRLIQQLLDGNEYGNGVVLGNSLSQLFGNVYLTSIDRKYANQKEYSYYRYADDIIFVARNKQTLYTIKDSVTLDLLNLGLNCRNNIIEVSDTNGFNTLGYVFYANKTHVRKSIKNKFIKRAKTGKDTTPYKAHIKHCNGKKLVSRIDRI